MSQNRLARKENWEELAEVWERYRPRFYRKAFRQLGCREDAEDAVQDALICAMKGIEHFRGESNLSTWLYSIVVNSARSILRRQLRHDVLALDQPCDEEGNVSWADLLADSAPQQDELYAGTELGETFDSLLQRLPPAQRRVCSLRVLNGFSMREIAEHLGVPEGTAKAQLARGRAKLIRHLRRARSSGPKLAANHVSSRASGSSVPQFA